MGILYNSYPLKSQNLTRRVHIKQTTGQTKWNTAGLGSTEDTALCRDPNVIWMGKTMNG